jgi:protein TonB
MLAPLAFLLALQPQPPAAAAAEPITGSSARLGSRINLYYTADDYPRRAVREEAQGVVSFRLTVLPTGRVGNCTVTASSGHERLDSATCRILTSRVRYRPARPGGGIAGADIGWVRYVITPGLRRPQPSIVYTH